MLGRLLRTILLATVALSWSACDIDTRSQAIQAEAKKFLSTFTVPSPETQPVWGMSEFRVIGLGADWAWGQADVNPIAGNENAVEIALDLWCVGKSLAGEPLKLRRNLHLTAVTEDGGATWRIDRAEFHNDQPLTLLRQILWWMLGAFVVTPVIFGIGFGLVSASSKVGCLGGPFNFVAALFFLFGLFLPAYLANGLLDSTVFAIIAFVGLLIVTGYWRAFLRDLL